MKIILFIPWFGPLPNYFSTFLKSIEHLNGVVDFILTTDANTDEYKLPANLKVYKETFKDFQNRVKNTLGENNNITHPYKLCDYKPLRPIIFSEYLSDEYEYCGYCDVDTVFGDVEGILNKIEYKKYDRIGPLGHFTIYRNNGIIKSIYQTEIPGDNDPYHKFSYISKTTYPCHFDEEGMNLICDYLNIPFYQNALGFNTAEKTFNIHTWNHNKHELLTWENGHTYRYFYDQTGKIQKEEMMYIHYGCQKYMTQLEPLGNMFYLSREGFKNFDPSKLEDYLKTDGRPDTAEELLLASKTYKKKLRKNRRERILRELKTYGLRALIRNIRYRIPRLYDVIFRYKNL
ncbi:MAG: hypothetical protein Q4C30_09655 [Bacteroidia bacterium]|nr:hypothetical protein [Bacteroidia bacterium]